MYGMLHGCILLSGFADITCQHDKDTKTHNNDTNDSGEDIQSWLYEHDQHGNCKQTDYQNLFNHR